MPDKLSGLPLLTDGEAKADDFIIFTELACDASTSWQPQMTTRTAKILSKPVHPANGEWQIQLSTRDVKPPSFDEEGNRVFTKFEVPDDDADDENGKRERTLQWSALGDVRLLRRIEDAGVME